MACRVQLGVETGIAFLDPQQIAVCTRLTPAAEDFFRLFPEGKRHPQFSAGKIPDPEQDPFDQGSVGFRLDLAGLDGDGAVAGIIRPFCHADNGIFVQLKTGGVAVAFPDPAVETILAAEITHLDQPAQADPFADGTEFDFIRCTEKCLRFRMEQEAGQLLPVQGTGGTFCFFQQGVHRVSAAILMQTFRTEEGPAAADWTFPQWASPGKKTANMPGFISR